MGGRARRGAALLAVVLAGGLAAGQAESTGEPAVARSTCTAAQKAKRVQALASYRKQMPKQRAAYFKRHRNPRVRAAFVKRQRAKLAALQKAARCRVAAPPSSSPPIARRGPLAAGTYRGDPFSPAVRFTVGSGWFLPFDTDDAQFLMAQKTDPGGRSLALDSFGSHSVADRVADLRSLPGLTAEAALPATLAGFAGQRFDALTTATELVLVPGLADRYELEPNDRIRVYVLDVRGRTVTFIIEAPAAEWNGFAAVAESVLATVQFPA